jgi:hypothetical protein
VLPHVAPRGAETWFASTTAYFCTTAGALGERSRSSLNYAFNSCEGDFSPSELIFSLDGFQISFGQAGHWRDKLRALRGLFEILWRK